MKRASHKVSTGKFRKPPNIVHGWCTAVAMGAVIEEDAHDAISRWAAEVEFWLQSQRAPGRSTVGTSQELQQGQARMYPQLIMPS